MVMVSGRYNLKLLRKRCMKWLHQKLKFAWPPFSDARKKHQEKYYWFFLCWLMVKNGKHCSPYISNTRRRQTLGIVRPTIERLAFYTVPIRWFFSTKFNAKQ